jgi:hypothetical protein
VQIRRYCFEDNEFVAVELVEEVPQLRITTTKGLTAWSWDYYESEHGKEATQQFRTAVEAIAALVKQEGWDLPYNLNKYYTGFKLGSKVVFSVAWGGTYAWKVKCKLGKEDAVDFKGQDWEFQTYDDTFGEAVFRPTKPSPETSELEPFFLRAYRRVSGTAWQDPVRASEGEALWPTHR